MARGHIRPARSAAGQEGRAWQVVVDTRSTDGQRRQHWVTVHGARRDAERELTRLLREADTGHLVSVRDTLSEYLDRWLTDWAPHHVAPQTIAGYRTHVRRLQATLGSVPLGKLTALQIERAIADLLKAGLAPGTVCQLLHVLRAALRQGVRWRLLAHNPAADVDPPRQAARPPRALAEQQALALLRAAAADRDGLVIVLALGLGLRAGEVYALHWESVDFGAGIVWVRRSLQRHAPGEKEPKGGKVRQEAMPEFVRLALHAEQERQAAIRGEAPGWNPLDLVVPNALGRQVYRHTTPIMARICEAAGVPRARLHDMRHTLTSLLLAAGESPRAVADALGHSRPSITLDVYSETLPGGRERTAARIQAILGNG